jgi:hypothetical protein
VISTQIRVKFNHLPAIQAQIRPAVSQVVRKTALGVEGDVKTEMRGPKSGRLYRRGGRTHQASAPGQAPAVDFGQLINSIQVQNVTDLTSTVGTNVEYAMALEMGSRRIAPRPVWRSVIEKWRQPFTDAITHVLRSLK